MATKQYLDIEGLKEFKKGLELEIQNAKDATDSEALTNSEIDTACAAAGQSSVSAVLNGDY